MEPMDLVEWVWRLEGHSLWVSPKESHITRIFCQRKVVLILRWASLPKSGVRLPHVRPPRGIDTSCSHNRWEGRAGPKSTLNHPELGDSGQSAQDALGRQKPISCWSDGLRMRSDVCMQQRALAVNSLEKKKVQVGVRSWVTRVVLSLSEELWRGSSQGHLVTSRMTRGDLKVTSSLPWGDALGQKQH